MHFVPNNEVTGNLTFEEHCRDRLNAYSSIWYAHFIFGGNVPQGLLIAALLFSCVVFGSAEGPDAIVTFYSHGSHLTTGLPGTTHDIYFGSIFDGTQGMFSFLDSHFAHNNRYITLRFIPGPHTFGASNGKRPEDRETLSIDLKAGQNYFIRAQGETKGVPGVFTIQHGRLDLMSCAEAQTDMAKAKPLKEKALWKKTRSQLASMVVNETSPPACN